MRQTVLLVEDEPGIAGLLRDVLEDEGYAVLVATDGVTGLRRVRTERPDLLLSNIQMPQMSGADMVRAIRAESAFDGMPIILMSAAAALGEGVPSDGFFEKPFQLDTLIATVARLLGLARVQVNAPGGTGA